MELRDRIISTLAGALVLASGAARPADVHGAGAVEFPALKPVPVFDAEGCKPSPVDPRVGAAPARVGFFDFLAKAWGDALNQVINQL